MFTADVPEFVIDLERSEDMRWADVIAAEHTTARQLIEGAAEDIARVPRICRWAFGKLYQAFGGLYQGEMKAWADALGVSTGTATMLNCLYELSHLPFGCTAGVRRLDGYGLVHVRTLDWPIAGMGQATRLFRFKRGSREFVSIGVPAQIGVLSGMVPNGYSVTINWAPPAGLPTFDFGPSFLLRDVLETCDSYSAAVDVLARTPLSASVFFTICGAGPEEACVIERTRRAAAIRTIDGPALVQANHHFAAEFIPNNEAIRKVPPEEEVFSIAGSTKRVNILQSGLDALSTDCTLQDAAEPLDIPTVLNSQTCQKMVFCPRTGEVKVWRLID
jgi:hypothetical protein